MMPTVSELMSQNNTNAMMNYRLWGELVYVVTAYDIFPDGTDVTNKLQALVNLAKAAGRTAIFFPAGEYYVTGLSNTDGLYFFGDNASFVGGYSETIAQFGQPVDVREGHASILYKRAIDEGGNIPKSSLMQAKSAVRSGTIRVAFWGDSITEGADQTNPGDAYPNRLIASMFDSIKGVTVTSQNFSLGGRMLSQAISPTFVGIAGPEPYPPPANGFYRPWSTVGKSWIDTIRDWKPDLLIVAFGMNDVSGTAPAEAEATNLKTLYDATKTWNPAPSLIVVPTILPTKNFDLYPQSQNGTNSVARATREFGKANGLMVADANRLFQILRDGVEEITRASYLEPNFQGYEDVSLWTGDRDAFTYSSGVLTPISAATNKYVTRSKVFYNGQIQVDIRPVNATDTAWINYRKDSTYGYMTVFVQPGSGTGAVSLYKGDTGEFIYGVGSLNVPMNQWSNIKIIASGISHAVYLNDTLVFQTTTYKNLHDGLLSIGSSQTSVAYRYLNISFEDSITTVPPYTESDLLGEYNSPESGNGINHPTGEGHALVYTPTFGGLLRTLANPVEYGNFIPIRLTSSGWQVPSSPFPTTTTAGEKLFYQVVSYYEKSRGIALRRLDNGYYYNLSSVAVSQSTLASLEVGKFCFYTINDTQALIFISISGSGSVTFDCDMFRYEGG
ncbi:SGNH/GDSL hydrolase family protein [Paenibacillus polysaccharolyticus]